MSDYRPYIAIVVASPQVKRQLEDQFGWDSRVRIIMIGEIVAGYAFDSVIMTHSARELIRTNPDAEFWWRDVMRTRGTPGYSFPEINYEG